jgi:hypothetical protein
MTKMIRAFLALTSFALCSALFAGSADLSVSSGQITIYIGGTHDGDITITDIATNQVVATVSALSMHGPGYGTSYRYSGDTYVSGVAITSYSDSYGVVSGLPAGDYRVTATAWQMSDFGSWSNGSWAEIDLYDPYWGSSWMDFDFSTY